MEGEEQGEGGLVCCYHLIHACWFWKVDTRMEENAFPFCYSLGFRDITITNLARTDDKGRRWSFFLK